MENARILHIEDDPFLTNIVKLALDIDVEGHKVVEKALNMDEARMTLNKRAIGESDYNVVLMDGNLSRESRNGADAKKIVAMIKMLNIDVVTIGCSGDELKANLVDVDYEISKNNFSIDKLIFLLNSIDK